jgi:hypothetical protein
MRMVRQGDVLLLEVLKLPEDCKEVKQDRRVILAYGEATGHTHELIGADSQWGVNLPARLFEQSGNFNGRRFLFVERACLLTHQEHDNIPIGPGFYEVIQQREYSPESGWGNVAD